MVVFTCNHCGESLQKPKVEKHYVFVCRNVKSLTCVDCFKDFRGEEYAVHTKCITEEERYAAKGSMPNGVIKKGELKQESWVDMVKSILDKEPNLHPSYRNLLNTISAYTNIPRKKQKFINFIKSSSGGRANLKDVEAVWNVIEKYKTGVANQTTNGSASTDKKNKNEENKKRKLIDQAVNGNIISKKMKTEHQEIEKENTAEEVDRFSFQEKILEILHKKACISKNKLEKKVLNAYLKWSEQEEININTLKKYQKKLKKLKNVKIDGDVVMLVDL